MNEKAEPYGIRGWLILPMLGLIISPLMIAVLVLTTLVPVFTGGTWELLTTPGTESYHILWAPFLIYELTGNIIFILFSVILLFLLFKKHYLLPMLMIIYYTLNLLFVGIDFFGSELIPAVSAAQDTGALKELVKSIISFAIWVPYFIKSKRVKNTFVKITDEVIAPES